MKKLLVSVLMSALLVSMTACGSQTADVAEAGEELVGGWTIEADGKLTDEAKNALDKATEELVGASYEPVKLLATQLVSGTNYAILCKVTPVVPDAESSYCIAYVYENLEGSAELTRVQDLEGDAENIDATKIDYSIYPDGE